MPAYVTHALFAQQALEHSGFALRDCCLSHANLFRFGAQGPDAFYFLNYAAPLKGYGALADAMHALAGDSPLEAMHELSQRDRERGMMCAYLCGFASHLALDGAAHPFVEERAADIAASEGVSPSCAHVMLESRFEARYYNEQTGRQACDYLYEADLPICEAEREAVARAWGLLLPLVGAKPRGLKALACDQRRLPQILGLMFCGEGAAAARACEALKRIARRDFSLRWQLKRAYDGASAPMTENDYGRLADAYARALEGYLRLMSG